MGTEFPWRWGRGTISANLDVIWGMSAKIFDAPTVETLRENTWAGFSANRDLLEARRLTGKVRHGHGDLHLRNICLVDGRATLFDALEFNEELACCDVLDDLAFLIMDLLARDLPGLANRALNRYLWRTGDWQGMPVFRLLLSCRAAVRAKTSAISANTGTDATAKHLFTARARDYLVLATRLLEPATPQLVAVGGLSGTGKSTLALGLAPRIGSAPSAIVVRSDVLRKQLSDTAFDETLSPPGYGQQATKRVYDRLDELTGGLLDGGWPVVSDAVFAIVAERQAIQAVADRRSLPFTGIWLDAPAGKMVERVTQRRCDASDADAAVVRRQADYDVGSITWRRIDASGTPDETLARSRDVLTDNPKVV